MTRPVAVRPREALKQPLPALKRGPDYTRSPALGDRHVQADIQLWDTFENEVRGWLTGDVDWKRQNHTISYRPRRTTGVYNTLREHVLCGDEGGVEGRIQANIGQPLSAVYQAIGYGMSFGDYRAATGRMAASENPDVAIMTPGGESRAVGEVKTPWVEQHSLQEAVRVGGDQLRNILAQEARYMREGNLRYGFISTYNQTLWIKQEEVDGQ